MNVVAFAGEVATIPPGRKGKKELIIHFERLKKMGGKKKTNTNLADWTQWPKFRESLAGG